jgi:hypothetical protein
MYAERFFNARRSGLPEKSDRLVACRITRNKNHSRRQLRAVAFEPIVHVRSGDPTGRPEIGYDAAEIPRRQQLQTFHRGWRRNHFVASPFERDSQKGRNGGLVFD